MTPLQLIQAARNQLNAGTDSMWSDAELYTYVEMCANEMNMDARCIKASATSNGVSGTAAYSLPTDINELIEVRYEGRKLQRLGNREKDTLVPDNTVSLSGYPVWYEEFDDSITLYPTPSANSTNGIVFKYYATEPTPTAASTLSTPARYHWALVDGVLFRMSPKDLGHPLTVYWQGRWDAAKKAVGSHVRRSRRGDTFGHVQAEEDSLTSDFGTI
jgi:hypothetical protein